MIFISLGTQKFQFDRLLKEIDNLIDKHVITSNEVFAQIGYSTYKPRNYPYINFLNNEEFEKNITHCNVLITHGGTGSIITGLKNNKKVIAVPRNFKFDEHVDNHQYEIVQEFSNSKLIEAVYEVEMLESALRNIQTVEYRSYQSNTQNIIRIIEEFIDLGK
ncbi:PssE/Cps14G family polysaccharide biosynthesis glycosyltransferase [Exiguobacterium sp. s36]|uniref:PssE/Cps14G family polysaccharide biosynthesis glycosyltransferase n=1 Tax=Exiguobacterium sp. s36 TaxID=2751227 RepID=UPI001BEB6B61|nr:PssE/Cps14G family polysaccharide biosynthesis glycosyltransferase [Exiguobacterium sp. s36]